VILPTQLEVMTLDQALILMLDDGAFGGTSKATPAEAVRQGVIDASKVQPQSKAARARAEAEARRKAERRKNRRDKRRRAR
jgi:hypothetical protein